MGTIKTTNIEPIADNGTVTLGSSGDTFALASGVFSRLGVFESQLLHVRDEKASGTQGGSFTTGAWRTRDLNTIKTNEITGASLSSNQITLPTGTYYIEASAPAYNVSRHQTALYNITDSSFEVIGTSEFTQDSKNVVTRSFVKGRFTISAQKTLELQHQNSSTHNTYGFGVSSTFSQVCVFADLQIWRTA